METLKIYAVPYGLPLLAIGLIIRYWIGQRRFARRGVAGLPQFRSYRRALIVTAIENLLDKLAGLFIAAGGLLLAAAAFIHFNF